MTTVVHCTRAPYDVYGGRPGRGRSGPWGNPFAIGMDPVRAIKKLATVTAHVHIVFDGPLDRTKAIECFRVWFLAQPEMVARAKAELRGKVIGCWCSPLACHCDVYVEVCDAA